MEQGDQSQINFEALSEDEAYVNVSVVHRGLVNRDIPSNLQERDKDLLETSKPQELTLLPTTEPPSSISARNGSVNNEAEYAVLVSGFGPWDEYTIGNRVSTA